MFHFIGGIFTGIFTLASFAITAVAGLFLFSAARQFVRNRLRYVDAVRNPVIPWGVAIAVAVVLIPVVWILPFVGGGTALIGGAASGLGTASGVKALRRGE